MRRLLLCILLLWNVPVQAGTRLVTTIKPLTLLAKPLLAEDDRLTQLLGPNQSPHQVSLTMSQRAALADADIVLWVGPGLEAFLQPLLARTEGAIRLDQLPGLSWPQSDGEEPGKHTHADHHHEQDPHLWLNPANAKVWVTAIARALIAARPALERDYQARAQQLLADIATAEQALHMAVKPASYISFHAAYGHWDQAFGSRQRAALALTPEQKPSARHLYQLQQLAPSADCLLAEPQYQSRQTHALAQQLSLPLVLADPLGEQAQSYVALMRALARAMAECSSHRS